MKKISAVIIDTYPNKQFASLAIKMTQRLSVVDKIFTFTDVPFEGITGVEFIKIPPLSSNNEYGQIIFEHIPEIINSSHVLIFQWDGFPLNPNKWKDTFLEYDYIGAPSGGWVGNGGFSIRSRKLVQSLKKLDITVDLSNPFDQPEDQIICTHKKALLESYGINFAPVSIASEFSFESGRLRKDVLGFHAAFNFPHFFTEADLIKNADSIISRISQPQSMLPYLNVCVELKMFDLLKVTLNDFREKPNLLKAFHFLSAQNPNSPLLEIFTNFE
jgi:hypothetical protein